MTDESSSIEGSILPPFCQRRLPLQHAPSPSGLVRSYSSLTSCMPSNDRRSKRSPTRPTSRTQSRSSSPLPLCWRAWASARWPQRALPHWWAGRTELLANWADDCLAVLGLCGREADKMTGRCCFAATSVPLLPLLFGRCVFCAVAAFCCKLCFYLKQGSLPETRGHCLKLGVTA